MSDMKVKHTSADHLLPADVRRVLSFENIEKLELIILLKLSKRLHVWVLLDPGLDVWVAYAEVSSRAQTA